MGGSGTGTPITPSLTGLQSAMSLDLAAFLNTADFAVTATFTHAGLIITSINVIFDDAFQVFNSQFGNFETSGPRATCKASDVSAAAHGDTLLIGALLYKVIGIQPSDDGLVTVLVLSRD